MRPNAIPHPVTLCENCSGQKFPQRLALDFARSLGLRFTLEPFDAIALLSSFQLQVSTRWNASAKIAH